MHSGNLPSSLLFLTSLPSSLPPSLPPSLHVSPHLMCRLVKNMSELHTNVGVGGVDSSSSNPLVKELQCIISRSNTNEGEEEGEEPTRISPTTGLLGTDHSLSDGTTLSTISKDSEFSEAVRGIFCNYFVEHFVNYEQFIIMPDQSYAQWLRNREQFENFDKTAFLSDQHPTTRTFYSAFLETAMFSLFIDQKLIATWDPPASDRHIVLFDRLIERHRQSKGMMTTPSSVTTPCK